MASLSFDDVQNFFQTHSVSQKSLVHLKDGVQIEIQIPGVCQAALFQKNGQPKLAEGPAHNPEVIFFAKAEAVERLITGASDDVGDFGIMVLKEYLNGGVRIQILGGLWALTTHGYLGIMKEAGPSFAKYLAQHGVGGIAKVFDHIGKLRKKPDLK